MIFGNLKLSGTDYGIIAVVVILVLIGLSAIYSASYHVESPALKTNFAKQILWFFISFILMFATIIIPNKNYRDVAYFAYAISIVLLILPLFGGGNSDVNRWISLGPLRFQPSEFAKICILLALARYLSHERRNLTKIKEISIAFGLILLPFMLVVKQPDLGTALVFISLILPVLYWAGLPTFYLFAIIAPFVVMLAAFNFYTFFAAMLIVGSILLYFRKGFKVFLLLMILNISVGIITPFLW
ncbi:hypothetical protein GF337_17885, partial [candidate division KSB1 bacterium]|nr:hypothetical protein [candidate division KSB1 bacterium]